MKSGVNIDCNYIVRVSKLMEKESEDIVKLPRPNKKITDVDGKRLPIIFVECEV